MRCAPYEDNGQLTGENVTALPQIFIEGNKYMSTKVIGEIAISKIPVSDQILLAFQIVKLATDNSLGIVMGANSYGNKYLETKPQSSGISFALSDDPLDNNCEYLFSGDDVTIETFGHLETKKESLVQRMLRVQNFLSEVMNNKDVIRIILEIDPDAATVDPVINIIVSDFKETMLMLFKENDNIVPNINICIRKA